MESKIKHKMLNLFKEIVFVSWNLTMHEPLWTESQDPFQEDSDTLVLHWDSWLKHGVDLHNKQSAVGHEWLKHFRVRTYGPKDGMDQAKWTVPRMRRHLLTKELGKYQRPRLKLHACWCHHVGLFVYLVDPRLSADASMTVECAARSIDRCMGIFEQKSVKPPANLVAFTDNTVRENKNTTTLGYLSVLAAQRRFQSTSFLNHRVGHSHGPLDQIFGIIGTSFKYVDQLADGEDAVQTLD